MVELKGGVEMDLPKCQKCNNGVLIPLSDYGQEGASVMYKAWACTNPDCGFSLRIDKGEVTYGKKNRARNTELAIVNSSALKYVMKTSDFSLQRLQQPYHSQAGML